MFHHLTTLWPRIFAQKFWVAAALTCVAFHSGAQSLGIQPLALWHPETGHYVDVMLSVRASTADDQQDRSVFVMLQKVNGGRTHYDKVAMNFATGGQGTYVEQIRLAADTGLWDLYVIRLAGDAIQDSVVHRMYIEPIQSGRLAPSLLTEEAQEQSAMRYGIKVQPRPVFGMAVYDNDHATMSIYQELYSVNRERYIINTSIEDDEKVWHSTSSWAKIPGGLTVLAFEYDLDSLPRGIYTVNTFMLDPDSKDTVDHIQKTVYRHRPLSAETWQRGTVSQVWSGSVGRGDTSRWHLNALYPIASKAERRQIDGLLAQKNDTLTWLFFEHFWKQRDPLKPNQEWASYQDLIWELETAYGTRQMPGYACDRGRIMLQYGPPSRMEQRPYESDGYPFEIWQYDIVKSEGLSDQFNRVFVFADFSTVGRNYVLIHSNVRGEIQNPRWRIALQKRTYIVEDLEHTGADDESKWGSRIYDNMFFNSGGR